MIFKSPEDADRFFLQMETTVRQMADIMGKDSDAYIALQMYEEELAKGNDVVVVFNEHGFEIGPRPSWDILSK